MIFHDETELTWDVLGRRLLATNLFEAQDDVGEAFFQLQEGAKNGEALTTEQVEEARDALEAARYLLETSVVPLVDGVEPWERRPRHTPHSKLREWAPAGETAAVQEDTCDA